MENIYRKITRSDKESLVCNIPATTPPPKVEQLKKPRGNVGFKRRFVFDWRYSSQGRPFYISRFMSAWGIYLSRIYVPDDLDLGRGISIVHGLGCDQDKLFAH